MARILVAEDEEHIRRILLLQLEMEGYEAGSAASGEECLTRVATYQPDLLILDYLLPDRSGDEVIDTLRKAEDTLDLPVILLSGLDPQLIEEGLLSDPGVFYLAKPFNNEELLTLVRQVLAPVEGE